MDIASVGIDLGKTTFHVVALNHQGSVVVRKKFSRKQLLAYTANLPSSVIGTEACSGAHFLGATLRDQGHHVRLIPAQFVKPFLKSNENDFLDAEAIAEAVTPQNMRFVPIKTDDQLDLQALHRVRERSLPCHVRLYWTRLHSALQEIMMSIFGRRVVLAWIILACSSASLALPPEPQQSISLTTSFRTVDGKYLEDVAVSDLSATEDQRPGGKIVSVGSMLGVPREFCVVVGRNHEVQQRLEYQKALALRFLREIVDKTDAAIVFSYNVKQVNKLAGGKRPGFDAAIQNLKSEGGCPDMLSHSRPNVSSDPANDSWWRQLMNGNYSRGNLARFADAAPQVTEGGAGMALVHCAAWFEEQKSPTASRFVVLFADDQWGSLAVPAQMGLRVLQMESAQLYAFGFKDDIGREAGSNPLTQPEPSRPQQHLNRSLLFLASGTGGAAYFMAGEVRQEQLPSLGIVRARFNGLRRVVYLPTRSAQAGSDPHTLLLVYKPDKLLRINVPSAFYPPN